MANSPAIHGHSSSSQSGSPESLANLVKKAVNSDADANLLTFTEVGKPDRAAELVADGWGSYTPDTNTDVAVMWLKSVWENVWTDWEKVTDKTWVDNNGNTRKAACATAVLDNKANGKRLWISVMHLPPHVQEGKNFSNDAADQPEVKVWKAGCAGWADYHRDTKHGADATMYVADWNVDCKVSDWRQRINNYYPNCHCSWKSPYPSGGTHGDRLIDATWTTMSIDTCKILPKHGSSDHKPFGEILRWS